MKNKLKNLFQITLLLSTFLLCLLYPELCMRAATKGLLQWYQHILPILFPFMILTSLLHILHYDTYLSSKCNWLMKPFARYSKECSYIIPIGFLCGFPMGAKLVHDAYCSQRIQQKEATYLLSFCNNISPAFFVGVVIPILDRMNPERASSYATKIPYIFCMYGIPLLYGFLLQFSLGKNNASITYDTQIFKESDVASLPEALDIALTGNIMSIVKLGCYIMIFQIYSTYLVLIFKSCAITSNIAKAILCALLEIVNGSLQFSQNGIQGTISTAIFFFLLQFGGISCILQTSIFLQETNIKLTHYIYHKTIIGILAAISYVILNII